MTGIIRKNDLPTLTKVKEEVYICYPSFSQLNMIYGCIYFKNFNELSIEYDIARELEKKYMIIPSIEFEDGENEENET